MTLGKHRKHPRKVVLPLDRTGTSISIGDVLEWEDGTRMRVDVLNWYGDDFWTTEDESGDYSDNLKASLIVWRRGK